MSRIKPQVKQKSALRLYVISGVSTLAILIAVGLTMYFTSQNENSLANTVIEPSTISSKGDLQVNAFAKVNAANGVTLSVSHVNEDFDAFQINQKVILIQMQDSIIGNNTSNNSSFGSIASIQAAGQYEILTISSVNESGGIPTSITLENAPTKTFNFTENSSVQLVSYPRLGGGSDYTTVADITTRNWDGNIGGVLCFYVDGDLNIGHNISTDGAGFKGGVADINGSSDNCNTSIYYIGSNNRYAAKGNGIYKNINSNYTLAAGHLANGAGGGNSHNGGGGGGGNFTTGGNGGPGWQCTAESGGRGGVSLNAYISSARIFLGGGGGSGEGNNNCAGAGGTGGGIIILSTNSINTNGTCTGLRISANGEDGETTPSPGNDGAGGGGAGGSIMLFVDDYNISNTCDLTIAASGGIGGTVNHNAAHGAGGGGGMGTIIFSIDEPSNVTTDNTAGIGGANSNVANATTTDGGSGNPDDGVIDISSDGAISLPIELLYFNAEPCQDGVCLKWETATEIDNDYFTLERSYDGINYNNLANTPGSGTTNTPKSYFYTDENPGTGIIYYKLKQTDYDGKFEYFPPVSVNISENKVELEINKIYPNPFQSSFTIEFNMTSEEEINIQVINANGQVVIQRSEYAYEGLNQIRIDDDRDLAAGYYYCTLSSENRKSKSVKLLKNHP